MRADLELHVDSVFGSQRGLAGAAVVEVWPGFGDSVQIKIEVEL